VQTWPAAEKLPHVALSANPWLPPDAEESDDEGFGHGPSRPNGAVLNSDHGADHLGSGKVPSLVRRAASEGLKTPVGKIAEDVAPQTQPPPMSSKEEW